tara:strand:- start:6523 stop:6804 length:282 start_codon:yes stop_codon:yes gene_type:complete
MAKNKDKKRKLNQRRKQIRVKNSIRKEKNFVQRMRDREEEKAKGYSDHWECRELARWLLYAGEGNAAFTDAGDAIQKYADKFNIDLIKLENAV